MASAGSAVQTEMPLARKVADGRQGPYATCPERPRSPLSELVPFERTPWERLVSRVESEGDEEEETQTVHG